MIRKIDKKNKFVSMFNPKTGFYMRSGVIEDGQDFGGLASITERIIVSNGINAEFEKCGYSDFVCQASQESIYEKSGMTALEICKKAQKMCRGE